MNLIKILLLLSTGILLGLAFCFGISVCSEKGKIEVMDLRQAVRQPGMRLQPENISASQVLLLFGQESGHSDFTI